MREQQPLFNLFEETRFSVEEMRDDILSRFDLGTGITKADPIYQLASVFAEERARTHTRINQIAFKFVKEIERINKEKEKPKGTLEYYLDIARRHPSVVQASGERGSHWLLYIHLLVKIPDDLSQNENPITETDVLNQVQAALNSSEAKLLNDAILVRKVTEVPFDITARVYLEPGTVLNEEALTEKLKSKFDKDGYWKVGRNLSESKILSFLHSEGVDTVDLKSTEGLREVEKGEILKLNKVTISI